MLHNGKGAAPAVPTRARSKKNKKYKNEQKASTHIVYLVHVSIDGIETGVQKALINRDQSASRNSGGGVSEEGARGWVSRGQHGRTSVVIFRGWFGL